MLGLDKAQAYLANRRAHEIRDWGSHELDAEGLALQAELEERLKVRMERCFQLTMPRLLTWYSFCPYVLPSPSSHFLSRD